MLPVKQSFGKDCCTYFTLEKDVYGENWSAVMTRNEKVLKQAYGIGGTFDEACDARGEMLNNFWSYKLN